MTVEKKGTGRATWRCRETGGQGAEGGFETRPYARGIKAQFRSIRVRATAEPTQQSPARAYWSRAIAGSTRQKGRGMDTGLPSRAEIAVK